MGHIAAGADRVIIMVHSLTGHQHDHQLYNAARWFPLQGFSVVRFDLYSGEAVGLLRSALLRTTLLTCSRSGMLSPNDTRACSSQATASAAPSSFGHRS